MKMKVKTKKPVLAPISDCKPLQTVGSYETTHLNVSKPKQLLNTGEPILSLGGDKPTHNRYITDSSAEK